MAPPPVRSQPCWLALAALAWGLAVAGIGGCKSTKERASASANLGAASALPAAKLGAGKPHFVHSARDGLSLEQFIQREVERAEAENSRVVVYVGAGWCEPCRYFHEAIERGELDGDLPGTRFIEFDAERDGAELKTAGYVSKYVPLLAIPNPEGRCSGRMIEGSIKGPAAVRENLLPRLRSLLAGQAGT